MTVIPFPVRRRLADDICASLRPESVALLERTVAYLNSRPSVDAPSIERLVLIELSSLLIETSAAARFASDWIEGLRSAEQTSRDIRRLLLTPVDPRCVKNAAILRLVSEANEMAHRMSAAVRRALTAMSLPEAG